MDTIKDKLAHVEPPSGVGREKVQDHQERPIEMGAVSASTKGNPLGTKGDGGGGLQAL
jgi:hypothetical protein